MQNYDDCKTIVYYNNVKLKHYYLNNKFHRTDGPAQIYYYENRSIELENYFLYNKHIDVKSYDEFKRYVKVLILK